MKHHGSTVDTYKLNDTSTNELTNQLSYLNYAQKCIDVVENIADKYHQNGTIFPDEVKAIFKVHGLKL